jgi:Big-like domain-containing protein
MKRLLAFLLFPFALLGQTITVQPVGQTAALGKTATFSMVISDATCSVMWQRNGSNLISGTNLVSYTTPIVALKDNGAKYGAAVYNCKTAANAHAIPAVLTVVPFIPVLTSLMIVPSLPVIGVGQTDQLTVSGTYNDGSVKDLSSTTTWTSDTPARVSVANGAVFGVSLGTANITGSVGAMTATTMATVEPSLQITFLAANDDGSIPLNANGFPLAQLVVSQTVVNADGTSNTTPVFTLPDPNGATSLPLLYNPALLYQSSFFFAQQPVGEPFVFSPTLIKAVMPNLAAISFSTVLYVNGGGTIKSMSWTAN